MIQGTPVADDKVITTHMLLCGMRKQVFDLEKGQPEGQG